MNFGFYLLPLLLSFAISSTVLVFLIKLSREKQISRLGGVAIIVAFVLTLILDSRLVFNQQYFGIIFATLAILVFGIIDDFQKLSWKVQLGFQFAIAACVCLFGIKLEYVSNPWGGIYFFNAGWAYCLGLAIVIFWIVFLMNVLNWVDGADGVSGGITLISAGTIFFLSQRPEVNQPPIGIIAIALVGALLAFLLFNFHPAKIMAGTSGSMFMGFILATAAIFAGAKIATTLMVLAIPIIDALWVIGERVKSGKSIFMGDYLHLHFKLQKFGWSVPKICVFYYSITLIIAILALTMRAWGKFVTFAGVGIIFIGLLLVIKKNIPQRC